MLPGTVELEIGEPALNILHRPVNLDALGYSRDGTARIQPDDN